ncbi:PLP-dependent transferase [Leucogyrophana mollusca]|uniref:PLP-dependent transferase n=1 Tax=Leucogyrophana mollusca TaxID=85980 RepID=A0ACB8BQ06_9AGAM|nr:PLP-dependent transferase [Leucogyrophana mollusca]
MPRLSRRGQARLDNDVNVPLRFFIPGKYYDTKHNPEGVINMATAENSLMTPELLQHIHSHFHLDPVHLKYRVSLLSGFYPNTEQALRMYINETFHPRELITPEQIVTGPGLGAIFAQFIWHTCEEGEGVVITTPYYDSFARESEYHAQVKLVAAHIPRDVDPLSLAAIKYTSAAIEASNASGTRIRVVILCNPHNPLARVYPKETILAYATLAEKFDLHLLVDEVYGNEVFPSTVVPNPIPFESVLSMDVNSLTDCDPSRIHVLAGPAKDFGVSGLKVGVFVSQQNDDMVKLIRASLGPIPISSASDSIMTAVLNDSKFRTWFLEENRRRLTKAFERVASWCDFHKISYEPASAGVFVLLDLGPFLERLSDVGASDDVKVDNGVRIMLDNGVFLRPTIVAHDQIPTRFRMTFTLPPDTMLLGLRRLEKAFGLRQGWSFHPWRSNL